MHRRAALVGIFGGFEAARKGLEGLPDLDLHTREGAADEVELDPGWDGDFIIVAYPPGQQEEVIVRELAADRHVLAVERLASSVDEAQRCVTIGLNRGLRLAVLKLTDPIGPQIEQFAAWIDGGSEPEHSGRRWIAESVEATP